MLVKTLLDKIMVYFVAAPEQSDTFTCKLQFLGYFASFCRQAGAPAQKLSLSIVESVAILNSELFALDIAHFHSRFDPRAIDVLLVKENLFNSE